MSRVVILLIEDEDYAWELLCSTVSHKEGRSIKTVMVNEDHPETVAAVVKDLKEVM